MRSQVLQRESAGEGVDMSEVLQTHHRITPEQRSWLLCSVSAIPVNKVFLQEFNRNRDADLRFSNIVWFLVPMSRWGKKQFCPLCEHP